MNNAITKKPDVSNNNELSVQDVVRQVQKVQEVMSSVMREGEHYGKIPGCGDKPSLLQPGAEKLAFTFRLAPVYEVETEHLVGNHITYAIVCKLSNILTGAFVGSGVGTCSTMESKYRFRTEQVGLVPKEYWDKRDPSVIGGPAYSPKKVEGQWVVIRKWEHDNPADHYNTCLKIAKKRALVDAIKTATAASDIFTQDIEDIQENIVVETTTTVPSVDPVAIPVEMVEKKEIKATVSNGKNSNYITEKQRQWLFSMLKQHGKNPIIFRGWLKSHFGNDSTKTILKTDIETVIAWIKQ